MKIRAPRQLHIVDERKIDLVSIQYPHVKTPVEDFELLTGVSCMQSFQTSAESNGCHKTLAHTFCSRCGVHVLHATKASNFLHLNALTLKKNIKISPVDARDIDVYSHMKRLRISCQESDAGRDTKTTSRSISSDELIDYPCTEYQSDSRASSPTSPMSIRSSHCEENILGNQLNLTQQNEDTFDIRSPKNLSLEQKLLSSSNRNASKFRSPFDDDDVDCASLRSAPCRPPNGTIISYRRRNGTSKMKYGANGGLDEMDALSVASSISDNMYSTSNGFDSMSVYSRASSLRSLRSSEHSHYQLRKYLAKHVTPRHLGSSPGNACGDELRDVSETPRKTSASPTSCLGEAGEPCDLVEGSSTTGSTSTDHSENEIDDLSPTELILDENIDV
jgi:hypothetical protein